MSHSQHDNVVAFVLNNLPPDQKAAATLIADLYGENRELRGRLIAMESEHSRRITVVERRVDSLEGGQQIRVEKIRATAVVWATLAGVVGGFIGSGWKTLFGGK